MEGKGPAGRGRTKRTSTCDREMRSQTFRAEFDKEYAALEVSEFLARQMEEQAISVRGLAAKADVSATVIQGIKSGTRKNIEYATLKALMVALGCQITFRKIHRGAVQAKQRNR